MWKRQPCPACAPSSDSAPPSSSFSGDDSLSCLGVDVCRHNCSVAARQRCENHPILLRARPRPTYPIYIVSLVVVSLLAVAPSTTHAFSAELSRHFTSVDTRTKSRSENVRLVPNGRDVAAKRRRAAKLQEKQRVEEDVEQEEEDAECNDFVQPARGGGSSNSARTSTALSASATSLGDDFQDQDVDNDEEEPTRESSDA